METKQEAEKAVLDAWKKVSEFHDTQEHFARVCERANAFLTDDDIAKLINFGFSRSRIQQLRTRQAGLDALGGH